MPRFEHNVNRVLGVPSQSVALLATLFLRGPQTAAELRANSARLHSFADISSVESFLDELAANEPPRVVRLSRTPGERESRWMHLLCGEASVSEAAARDVQGGESYSLSEFEALKSEQKRLAHEVVQLRAMVERMAGELGISLDQSPPEA